MDSVRGSTADQAEADGKPETPEDDGWEFALVEIMGFRKHAGRCREVERFGAKLLRIDVPIKGDPVANGWETLFYSGQSMFSYTPATEAAVMKLNKGYEPPHQYQLPALDAGDGALADEEEF